MGLSRWERRLRATWLVAWLILATLVALDDYRRKLARRFRRFTDAVD